MNEGKRLWVVNEQNDKGEPRKEASTLKNGNGEVFFYDTTGVIQIKHKYVNDLLD